MNKKTRDALHEEMPSIIQHINRIIVSNPDLRDSGLKFNGLLLSKHEHNPDVATSKAAFRAFIRPDCDTITCESDTVPGDTITRCSDKGCPKGHHPV
ncbi:hypothetical protein [Spirosoma flavum]|uniref:Uncharacterized protein n=1 Tax=Spirosoma flavum TaxID=2048557 RepID=A0ABW6AL02_9BACT